MRTILCCKGAVIGLLIGKLYEQCNIGFGIADDVSCGHGDLQEHSRLIDLGGVAVCVCAVDGVPVAVCVV